MKKINSRMKYIFMGLIIILFTILLTTSCGKKSQEKIKWDIIWNDEFEGESLDLSKWTYDYGNGYNGWGNYEAQYYQKANVSVENGNLVIEAIKEDKEGCLYTSGRIKTAMDCENVLFKTRYGKIEARIAMDCESGFWPAFWMMPVDNIYGSWPLSGEIDIMEARGRTKNTINGAIHFGEKIPNNKYSGGNYKFNEGEDISGYHIYSIEWEPDEIRWYVDGNKFYSTSNWYTMRELGEKSEYPAPFNQDFYLILNMAVGGTFDNGILPESNMTGKMYVDYVRVYQNPNEDNEISIDKYSKNMDNKQYVALSRKNNYILDTDFETLNTNPLKKSQKLIRDKWYFVTKDYFKGEASYEKIYIDNTTYCKVNIFNPGEKTYSVQLQYKTPLVMGYLYYIEFDAWADGERNIEFQPLGIVDGEEISYNAPVRIGLTTEKQHYYYSFIMQEKTDLESILEFNFGVEKPNVYIGNISLNSIE